MKVRDLLTKKKIVKYVDPGVSGPLPFTDLPKESIEARQVEIEPSTTTVVSDVIALADEVVKTVDVTLEAIKTDNSGDPLFSRYWEAATQAAAEDTRPASLDVLEREVYRKVRDPRAPYVSDLLETRFLASSAKESLELLKRRLMANLEAEETIDPPSKAYLKVYADTLEAYRKHTEMVGKIRRASLGDKFLYAVASRVASRLSRGRTPSEVQKIALRLARSLRAVRKLVKVFILARTLDWERFFKDVYEDVISRAKYKAHRKATDQLLRYIAEVRARALEFLWDLEEIADFREIGPYEPIPEAFEFLDQVSYGIRKALSELEAMAMEKERELLKYVESQELRRLNSERVSWAKEYLDMLSAAIDFLETFARTYQLVMASEDYIQDRIFEVLKGGKIDLKPAQQAQYPRTAQSSLPDVPRTPGFAGG